MSTSMASYGASTTTLASTIRTIWETELLKIADGLLVAPKFATTKVVGRGQGGTLRISRMLRVPKVTTADNAAMQYTYADVKSLTTNYIDLSPSFWGDSFGIQDDVDIQTFLNDPQYKAAIANQIARTMDYQVIKRMCTYGMRHRIDKDSTYQVHGTVDSATTATLVDDALTQIDDFWNGGFVTIYNPEGPNYDITRKVSDFVASTDTATHAAFPQACTTSSKYRLVVGTTIAATDVFTTSGLLTIMFNHEQLETEPFEGFTFRSFMSAAAHRDVWEDTIWQNTAIYDDSGRYKNYRLVRWADTEFLISSESYREDVDGTENQSTGVVYVTPIFGKNSYCVVKWGMGEGDFGVKWYWVMDPDSYNLRMGMRFISWKAYYATEVLRATSVQGLMHGCTDYGLGIH